MAKDRQQVSASDPTVTSEDFRAALGAVARVFNRGRLSHRESWRAHDQAYHCDRAIKHLEKWESGDDSEPLGLQIT